MERFFPGALRAGRSPAPRVPRPWWPAARARRRGRRCGSPTARRRSAAGCGRSCGRCAGCRRQRLGGGGAAARPRASCGSRRPPARAGARGVARATLARGADRRRGHRLRRPRAGPARRRGWSARRWRRRRSRSCSHIADLRGAHRRRRARASCFPPGDVITLAGQLERLVAERPVARADSLAQGPRAVARTGAPWPTSSRRPTARLAARRHDPDGQRRRCAAGSPGAARSTSTSTCTPTTPPTARRPVETLLEAAKAAGLGAIAITDHNEVSGAFAARELAEEIDGIKVIVAEEVKTAEQGEVIGLFLEEKIERGMTMARDDRRDPPPGRARLRAASRSTGCTRSPTTSTCSTWSRRSTSSRCSTRG